MALAAACEIEALVRLGRLLNLPRLAEQVLTNRAVILLPLATDG
jgi:hypothetical protein